MGLGERLRRIERRVNIGTDCPACGLPVDGRPRLTGVMDIPQVCWKYRDGVTRDSDGNPLPPPVSNCTTCGL